jgi:1-phosphofructokinase family hexose kinase
MKFRLIPFSGPDDIKRRIPMLLAVCLNPALQRTLVLPGFGIDRVNRAVSVGVSVGGKGVNAARVAASLGADVRLLLPLGGATGREAGRLLRDGRIRFTRVPVAAATRTCQTLVDPESETVTELVEEGGRLSRDEVRAVRSAFEALLPRAGIVVLSGTAPAGFPDGIYAGWIAAARRLGIPVLLDAPSRFALPALRQGPWLYKPNWDEMEGMLGRTVPSNRADDALRDLEALGADSVFVTGDGPVAFGRTGSESFRISCPRLRVLNPIGSGDAVAAGIAVVRLEGRPLSEAFRLGMACGAANVLTLPAGTIRRADVRSLLPRIRIGPIGASRT